MFIQIDGLNIRYTVEGEGPDLVLLHGWAAQIETFQPVQRHLARHFRAYSLDFPGFGESDDPPEPWGVEQYAAFFNKFLDALHIAKPILIGHSNGGRISICHAAAHPVGKIVLVDAAGIKPKRKLSYYVKVYSYKTVKNLLKLPGLNKHREAILNKYKARVGSTDYKNASGVMQRTLVKLVNADLRHLLPQIKAPTLLIWGENDTATPVADGKLMEKLLPDAGLVVLKNAGHFSYLDKLPEFLVIIDHFLSGGKGERNG